MCHDLLDEVQRLRRDRQPFALATVVAAEQPASGTPGARAIVLPGGRVEGWVGGHCAQPTVARLALAALEDGASRLVVLSPAVTEEGTPRTGVVHVPMRCAGQGELEIFIEPFLPRVELVVIGASPVARTLAHLGALMDFEVWACDPDADMAAFPDAERLVPTLDALRDQLTPSHFVVVATIGNYDEAAVEVALGGAASYVGLVASRKRCAALVAELRGRGVSDDALKRLTRPKGLPGRADLPAEIAFSVMAELLEVRRRGVGRALAAPAAPRAEAVDPICGMTVDVATARYTSVRDGETYYFCCAGCKKQFERQAAQPVEAAR
ncbi:MAG TPA: XdhC family protein [Steroidobacteraceae bacterium]|nr:XdhC family protein [Steroidobacteraceae bacterium]